jgi:ribosomal protein L27
MKKIILASLVLLGAVNVAVADVSSCYNIRDSDAKNLCIAQTKRQVSSCYNIRDSDAKNYCVATVNRQRSTCYNIRGNDVKNQCLAQVR